MGKIMVVGSINSDLVINIDRYPKAGETIEGSSFAWYPGGKGANQAVAASKLGADVQMCGAIGDDPYGEKLRQSLVTHGVDVDLIKTVPGASGVAMITVEASGENRIILAKGANESVTLPSDEQLTGVEWVVVQNEIPWHLTEQMIKQAADKRVKILFNPAPATQIPINVLPLVDVLVVNEPEAELITGHKGSGEGMINHLLKLGARSVVLTLGAKGAMYGTKDERLLMPAFCVDKVIDTTAAGDTFIGAFVAAKLRGDSIEEILRFATAASAIAITRAGAQTSIPTVEEVKAYLERKK